MEIENDDFIEDDLDLYEETNQQTNRNKVKNVNLQDQTKNLQILRQDNNQFKDKARQTMDELLDKKKPSLQEIQSRMQLLE